MTPAELKEIRKGLGMSQAVLANGIGLSLRGYEEIEAGRSELREIHINALTGYLLRYGIPEGAQVPNFFGDALKSAVQRLTLDKLEEADRQLEA